MSVRSVPLDGADHGARRSKRVLTTRTGSAVPWHGGGAGVVHDRQGIALLVAPPRRSAPPRGAAAAQASTPPRHGGWATRAAHDAPRQRPEPAPSRNSQDPSRIAHQHPAKMSASRAGRIHANDGCHLTDPSARIARLRAVQVSLQELDGPGRRSATLCDRMNRSTPALNSAGWLLNMLWVAPGILSRSASGISLPRRVGHRLDVRR